MSNLLLISLFLNRIGGWELIIILVVVLLLFGGKKIPELMRGIGKGVKSFKQGMNEVQEEINRDDSDKTKKN
ncbi:MAG: twin-arginine translocase TatA/TatE family subunit [Muribaculaceae bacterium]|nr:twin-arginine translocase TatA/TatE family subunit [Muribaculaceae bacterium]